MTSPADTATRAQAETIRRRLVRFVPDGFRDDDGVWHVGRIRTDTLAALDALVAELDRLQSVHDQVQARIGVLLAHARPEDIQAVERFIAEHGLVDAAGWTMRDARDGELAEARVELERVTRYLAETERVYKEQLVGVVVERAQMRAELAAAVGREQRQREALDAQHLALEAALAHAEHLRMDTPEDQAIVSKLAETIRLAFVARAVLEEGQQPPGVDRVFGICSTHGQYELPIASIESGEVARRCPGCVSEASAPVEEGQQ